MFLNYAKNLISVTNSFPDLGTPELIFAVDSLRGF